MAGNTNGSLMVSREHLMPAFQLPLRILYLLICRRHEITFDVPECFQSGVLDRLAYLPKSIIQYYRPVTTYQDSLRHGRYLSYWLQIAFDDYAVESLKRLSELRSTPLVVALLDTQSTPCFEALADVSFPHIVSSSNDEVLEKLRTDSRTESRVFASLADFRAVFEAEVLNAEIFFRTTGHKNLADLIEKIIRTRENHPEIINGIRFTNFRASTPNHNTIRQLACPAAGEEIPIDAIDHAERAHSMVEVLETTLAIECGLSDFEWNGRSYLGCLPPLILVAPYHDPRRVREWLKLAHRNVPRKHKPLIRTFLRASRWEQDSSDYLHHCSTADVCDAPEGFLLAMKLAADRVGFLDEVGYLHSAFQYSPYLRLPVKGRSLNSVLSPFELGRYLRVRDHRKTRANIADFGRTMSELLPSGVENFISGRVNQVFAISDLPVEWMLVKGVPLAFLCDVCRLPETPLASLMAEHTHNTDVSFIIGPDILAHTLVVCGVPPSDPITTGHNALKTMMEDGGLPQVTVEMCDSLESFRAAMEKHKPQFLIIDSHGKHDDTEVGSCFLMGRDWVTGDDISKFGLATPLVMLSCCATAPLYGNYNTIAHAFFATGAKSVVSTFLPISVRQGFILYVRVLNNLQMASTTALHPNWLSFMSHCLRTSYFDDCLSHLETSRRVGLIKEIYCRERSIWQTSSHQRHKRAKAYKKVETSVAACFPREMRGKVLNILSKREFIPEFLFYTHLGRADLVPFKCWLETHHCAETAAQPTILAPHGNETDGGG